MRNTVLYLSGPAGAGKSAVAQLLETKYGFHRIGLSGFCHAMADETGVPPTRRTLQKLGDALRTRMDDPAALAVLAWRRAMSTPGPVVIEGVRLHAEAAYLRTQDAIGVAVEAPELVRAARLRVRDGSDRVPAHATEREAGSGPVDLRIANGGDRPALEQAVRLAVAWAALLQAERVSRIKTAWTTGTTATARLER